MRPHTYPLIGYGTNLTALTQMLVTHAFIG